MSAERLGKQTSYLGQRWLIDLFAWSTGEQWQDTRTILQDQSLSVSPNGNGTIIISSQIQKTELFCHGKKVAEVSKTFLENGGEAIEVSPEPTIAFCEIDPVLLEKISKWAERQTNPDELCREIASFCQNRGKDGILFSAVSLWVFLNRKEAIRWG